MSSKRKYSKKERNKNPKVGINSDQKTKDMNLSSINKVVKVTKKDNLNESRVEEEFNESLVEDDLIRFKENKNLILSNFEEWIKLSTDNKITSKNSWQFGLIDYFYDLNVIKDGEDINFQRASATLDGCVKIYLSRIESAVSETGKLISGLAHGKNDIDKTLDDIVDEREQNERNKAEKRKRKYEKMKESTLVSFESIQKKNVSQDTIIDPVFRKFMSNFDEGGAGNLLFNRLTMNTDGRVVFDNFVEISDHCDQDCDSEILSSISENNFDFGDIKDKFFNKNENLNQLVVCDFFDAFHSLVYDVEDKNFETNEKMDPLIFVDSVVNNNDNNKSGSPIDVFDDTNNDYADENDPNKVKLDLLNQKMIEKILSPQSLFEPNKLIPENEIMQYFDEKPNKTSNKRNFISDLDSDHLKQIDSTKKKKIKLVESKKNNENKKLKIDFFNLNCDEKKLFESPKHSSYINKKLGDNRFENLLPDNIFSDSLKSINFFTKPEISVLYCFDKREKSKFSDVLTDENFYTNQHKDHGSELEKISDSMLKEELNDLEVSSDNEENFKNVISNDVLYLVSSSKLDFEKENHQIMNHQSNFLKFSHVSKKVDINLLRKTLWKTLTNFSLNKNETISFNKLIESTSLLYDIKKRKDLSKSFYFICLLHLANENGLILKSDVLKNDIIIQQQNFD